MAVWIALFKTVGQTSQLLIAIAHIVITMPVMVGDLFFSTRAAYLNS